MRVPRTLGTAAAEDQAMFFLQRLHQGHDDWIGFVEMAAGEEGIPILFARDR
jgi:hypothetical protein